MTLPIHHNHLLQGFLYHHLHLHIAEKLHSKGFPYEKRHFRLFTFSRLKGKHSLQPPDMKFSGTIHWFIATSAREFLESLVQHLLKSRSLKIGNSRCILTGIEVPFPPAFTSPLFVQALSPITVYSTLGVPGGKRKTYYYSPFEQEFSRLLFENLKKKYFLIHHQPYSGRDFQVEPVGIQSHHQKVLYFKKTVVKGWMGRYKMTGEPILLEVAYDTGLGAKNSQGFGMIEALSPLPTTATPEM